MHNYKKQNGTFQMAFALKTLFKNYCTKHKRKELFYINNPYGKIPRLEIPLNIKINQQKEGGVLTWLIFLTEGCNKDTLYH